MKRKIGNTYSEIYLFFIFNSINEKNKKMLIKSAPGWYLYLKSINLYVMWPRAEQWIGFSPSDKDVIKNSNVMLRRHGWTWLDGSDVTWSAWRGGEPTRHEGCAILQEKKELVGRPCSQSNHYICKQVRVCILPIYSLYLISKSYHHFKKFYMQCK